MNSRKFLAMFVCVILALTASYAVAVDQNDPAAFRLISNETETPDAYLTGYSTAGSDDSCSCNMDGCENVCNASRNCSRWTASAEFIIFDRIGTKSETLVRNNRIGDEMLNSNDFHQGFYGGPRVGIIRHGDRCYDLEVSYFQIDGWSSSRNLPANQDGLEFSVPGATIISTAFPMQLDYSSKLYNGEINLRWNPTCRITMLAGFRWVELDENLDASLVPATRELFFNSHTKNDLYGFQIGTDTKLWECGCFSIDGLVKGGIYNNNARQSSWTSAGAYVGEGSTSTNHVAFLGEAGLQCKYQVTCNLTLKAGYEAIWIDGVALAPGQMQASNFATDQFGINTDGGVFYHGATAGFEYNF